MKTLLKKNNFLRAAYRCVYPIVPHFSARVIRSYLRFWKTYFDYQKLQGKPPCHLRDLNIQIRDWSESTPLSYYFYQDTWAFHKITQQKPCRHIDIGSTALLVGCLAAIAPTISLDVRPLVAKVAGLTPLSGLITQLPFVSGSVESLSALCVIEHIGLGRYGDPLDPEGTIKAARELSRVLAPEGNLYVSVPCGRSYVAFNAHRSFDKEEFIKLFSGLILEEFVLVNNFGVVEREGNDSTADFQVGLFHFRK